MKCPRCQHENPLGQKFCGECGARLAVACASCGASNPPGQKFCGECGTGLVPEAVAKSASPESYTPKHLAERIINSKAALEGERKQVTVLFADLKGSMELLADRDPEEARKLLDPVLEHMMEAVHRYEGTVNQVMGDGIMALFGAPLALEDHAVRACYAALRMQEAVAQYAEGVFRSHGVPLQIRVGLNSGEVVVRAIGSDLHMDYTAVGQTTHLAARMEQMATGGTSFLTADTLRLAEGYVEVKPRGPVPVKGLDAPVEVYEMVGVGARRSRLHVAATHGLTRFVGRDRELELLREALARSSAGHGQVVAIVGEPGVGKSRLVWEVTHSHRVHGWLVLQAGSVSYGKATSYLPVIDLLKSYFAIEARDGPRAVREKVTGKLLTLDRALEGSLPAFLSLLDVPADDSQWPTLDPAQRRRRTLDAVKRLLLQESQVQPLLVVFEDLHWIDSETQALLDGLVESLPAARLMLLVNYRPEYQHPWGSRTYYTQLRLDPLPPATAEQLLAALLGSDAGLDPLKRILIARTEGNPFFLEESVRSLAETGALLGERGACRLARRIEHLEVPATIQAILAARIDRQSSEDKRLLQAAAVVGKDVPMPLLLAIAETPEDKVRGGLGRLQAAEFLYETSLFPELEYTFKHALTHEVAYGSLLQERRQALHRRVLEAIERLHADRIGEHVERLAHHALRGQVRDVAVKYLRQAGDRAAACSANREAVAFFEQALGILAELPETPDTLAATGDTRIALGPALVALKGPGAPEVEAAYLQARELAERLGDATRLYPALWGLWFVNYARGRYPSARDLGGRLLEVAERGSDTGGLLEAHHALWATLFAMGEPTDALAHVERGLALYDPARHGTQAFVYGGHDAGACCRFHLARIQWFLGYPDRAVSTLRDAVGLAEGLAHAQTMVITLTAAAFIQYQTGDREAARASAERAVTAAKGQGIVAWVDDGLVILACVAAREGGDGQRMAELYRRLTTTRASIAARYAINLCLLAAAFAEVGDIERGLDALSAIPEEHHGYLYAPEIQRIRGELILRRNDWDEGEQCFRRAIEIAGRRAERSLELRAATSLARLLAKQGRRDEARLALAAVHGWFTEGFATADLKEARGLLEELA